MSLVDSFFGDQKRHVAAPDVDRPVEDPLRPLTRDRHTDLLSDVAIGVIQQRFGKGLETRDFLT